jgi:hypothetical protein
MEGSTRVTLREQMEADAKLIASLPEEQQRLLREELASGGRTPHETREPEAPGCYWE